MGLPSRRYLLRSRVRGAPGAASHWSWALWGGVSPGPGP